MFVQKRNSSTESIEPKKIGSFVRNLCSITPSLKRVRVAVVVEKILESLPKSTQAREIPDLVAETAAAMVPESCEYGDLAGRSIVSRLHRETPKLFSESTVALKDGLRDDYREFVYQNMGVLDAMVENSRDYQFDLFGARTLLRAYLLRDKDGNIVERPQYMYLRVAIALNMPDINAIEETYEALSTHMYTHATPTLFNSGIRTQQLASCFLVTMEDDSIEGIFGTLAQCAKISKGAGGIGLSCSNIRSAGSHIRGTNGVSNGIVPMLQVYNHTSRYVNQSGKRPGTFATFLEPWHPDLLDWLHLKRNDGIEDLRARDLFYGLYISDIFMERVRDNKKWTFIDPNDAPHLIDLYGDEHRAAYEKAEKECPRKVVDAREVWSTILDSQIETGTPYLVYKDACNEKSNQKNLGCIRGSNLCVEIVEYTSASETAVCTLASISLPSFLTNTTTTAGEEKGGGVHSSFDFESMARVVRLAVKNLNQTIDRNDYPVEQARLSNMRHRPIGLGVQGLSDVFNALGLPFDSKDAMDLNARIFEEIYYAAVEESMELAKEHGPYETYEGSPFSDGKFQFDLWGCTSLTKDWAGLRASVRAHGLRNSLLTACMPTASTANIMGNSESMEPRTSNLYVRRVSSGEAIVANRYLQRDLAALGLWDREMMDALVRESGSVQNIDRVPDHLKRVYKTVWELSQKSIIDQSAGRAPFIDQSQSLNLYIRNPKKTQLTSMHFYAWKRGLKTGMYYLRTQPKAKALQFTVPVCESCSA